MVTGKDRFWVRFPWKSHLVNWRDVHGSRGEIETWFFCLNLSGEQKTIFFYIILAAILSFDPQVIYSHSDAIRGDVFALCCTSLLPASLLRAPSWLQRGCMLGRHPQSALSEGGSESNLDGWHQTALCNLVDLVWNRKKKKERSEHESGSEVFNILCIALLQACIFNLTDNFFLCDMN